VAFYVECRLPHNLATCPKSVLRARIGTDRKLRPEAAPRDCFGTPICRGSRTRVTGVPVFPSYRFFLHSLQNAFMQRPLFTVLHLGLPRRGIYYLAIALLAASIPLLADTPVMLHRVRPAGCYCHCEEAHRRAGCVKICDTKKIAPRWWSTTCVKPHMHTPSQDSHAGPRFPRPGRAEHAQL
jgi:hypothetical protein